MVILIIKANLNFYYLLINHQTHYITLNTIKQSPPPSPKKERKLKLQSNKPE